MSFITKRERVFNEYDLYDLPARNEGKLKAYSSCTDARAWSHFCSDKTEHLVEIIKKNNETCRPKYVPTDVIINTLMVAKNAEIGRLKHKIEEFEQMIAAYDQLELTTEQKYDIANAHAAIKVANKELDEMCLDLDLSGFTEGIDSEAFETGKSRGDETMRSMTDEFQKSKGDESGKSRSGDWEFKKLKLESKSNQVGQGELIRATDASTTVSDPRIDDMQEMIIIKDAKLNAMQNHIAVMENDVCEPYCIYAHIYTALEKIFATLCQNGKYKQYLNLLTADKDIRGLDLKGKILFKMKVLEKFCLALIAPCSQDYEQTSSAQDCSCYRAEIITTFALATEECVKNSVDDRRAQLVADIIDNQEMKEILSKESVIAKTDKTYLPENNITETDSLNRLKKLQANYDDLVTCYDNLKYEKDCLFLRCQRYSELEKECECMQEHLREYNQLWSEKEYYRKRSEELDVLKERYYVLSEETSNVEAKLKAESEINRIKCNNINYLQNENIALERKLQELTLLFEKEKNSMNCKLKEYECKIMCQDQQIKTLSLQIDKFIEQGHEIVTEDTSKSVELLNEIESQKEQIRNLKQALMCNEEEKQVFQDNFQDKLQLINELKSEIENWKEKSDKLLHSNICLEEYARDYQNQIQYLQNQNQLLFQEIESKKDALENLKEILDSKSKEINSLTNVIEGKESKNLQLLDTLKSTENMYTESLQSLKNESNMAIDILKSKQRESLEILDTIRNHLYNESNQNKPGLNEIQAETQNVEDAMKNINNKKPVLLNEINKLHDISVHSLHSLLDENIQYKKNLDISCKQSEELEKKLQNFEDLTHAFNDLKHSYEILLKEKVTLENELQGKKDEYDDLINSFQLTKKESEELNKRLNQTKDLKEEFMKINALYKKLIQERSALQNEFKCTEKDLENTQKALNNCMEEKESVEAENFRLTDLEKNLADLQFNYQKLLSEKEDLNNTINSKTREIDSLHNNLKSKVDENNNLLHEIELMKIKETTSQSDISTLKYENHNILNNVSLLRKESENLLEKLKDYENLQSNYNSLKQMRDDILSENQCLKVELNKLQEYLQDVTAENKFLAKQKQDLLDHSEDIEKALISARTAINKGANTPNDYLEEIKTEIESMKKEKNVNHKKISELIDKLDESDAMIINLQEDIMMRDNKISTLQNYINQLQAEVTHLNNNIAYAVESSEHLLSSNHKKMDESLKLLDEHHSTATQSIKAELTRLKNENCRLENELSNTHIKSEGISKENQELKDQISYLHDEKLITLQNIKELEIICFANSSLHINDCGIDDVVTSLNRIRQCIEVKNSKSTSLEQKLLTMQNSSKLLLSKADEAKKIAENEKQKISAEKEEAVKERLIMEKQLIVLETKLQDQIEKDQEILKDLDAKLLNQKLMFEKIDEVRQNYVTKLENEIQNFQNLYENSLSKIRELQEKAFSVSEDNTKKLEDIDKISKNLEKKSKEVAYLRRCIDDIKNKPLVSLTTQTNLVCSDDSCQTDLLSQTEKGVNTISNYNFNEINCTNEVYKLSRDLTNKHEVSNSKRDELLLTTSNLDFIKKVYLDYKIKKLGPTKLEQFIISGNSGEENCHNIDKGPDGVITEAKTNMSNDIGAHHKIIDIYNTHSIFAHNTEFSSKSPCEESTFELSNEDSKEYANENKSQNFDHSGPSTDNDIFLIYKDSGEMHKSDPYTKSSLTNPLRSKIVESVNHIKQEIAKVEIVDNNNKENNSFIYLDDDNVKAKLTLSLPRVATESLSKDTNLEYDKKSIDSYTVAIYTSPITLSDERDNISEITNIPAKDLPSYPDSRKYFITNDLINKKHDTLSPGNGSSRNINVSTQNKKVVKKVKETHKTSPKKSDNENSSTKFRIKRYNKEGNIQFDDKSVSLKENSDKIDTSHYKSEKHSNYGLKYLLDSVQQEVNIKRFQNSNVYRSHSDTIIKNDINQSRSRSCSSLLKSLSDYRKTNDFGKDIDKIVKSRQSSFSIERGVMAKLDNVQEYENKIKDLTKTLESIEKHYKKKIEAVKTQYDNNIKNIINEHNQGVESIQSLHEETFKDVIKSHESEIENLRTMSIEALRKVEKLESENRILKLKLQGQTETIEEPIKFPDTRKRRHRKSDTRTLTTTNIEAFNVKPKVRSHGPCTCTLDTNISNTIRTIFEQVDVDQRRMAEHAYTKYIAHKIINNNVEALDAQELAFLHLKVCRTWKTMLSEEEVLQKRIDSLENELLNKQRQTKQHIAELDRKVAEERRRLEEVREAVCRNTPAVSRDTSPQKYAAVPEKEVCKCCSISCNLQAGAKLSAGDLHSQATSTLRPRWPKQESNRAVSAKLDPDERKDKKHYHDEHPIRLRRSHDRAKKQTHKK